MNIITPTVGVVLAIVIICATLVRCSENEDALKRACIDSGGTVIANQSGSFHCIAGARK